MRDVQIKDHTSQVRGAVANRPQVVAAVAQAVAQLDDDTKAMCYQAWMGYYNSSLRYNPNPRPTLKTLLLGLGFAPPWRNPNPLAGLHPSPKP